MSVIESFSNSVRTQRSCQKYDKDFFQIFGLLIKPKLYESKVHSWFIGLWKTVTELHNVNECNEFMLQIEKVSFAK